MKMISTQLNSVIEKSLSNPKSVAKLHKRIEKFANEHNVTLAENDKENYTALCEAYVRTVVNLIMACDEASVANGTQQFTTPLLQTAVSYFLNPFDYIPDKKGLLGLLDDAYLACRFIARISQMFQAERGMPLLDTSLDQHSPAIRALIGEPLATQLDNDIEHSIQQVIQQLQFAQLQAFNMQHSERWAKLHQDRQNIDTARMMSIASGDFY